jgi:hypothetical protein
LSSISGLIVRQMHFRARRTIVHLFDAQSCARSCAAGFSLFAGKDSSFQSQLAIGELISQ